MALGLRASWPSEVVLPDLLSLRVPSKDLRLPSNEARMRDVNGGREFGAMIRMVVQRELMVWS